MKISSAEYSSNLIYKDNCLSKFQIKFLEINYNTNNILNGQHFNRDT